MQRVGVVTQPGVAGCRDDRSLVKRKGVSLLRVSVVMGLCSLSYLGWQPPERVNANEMAYNLDQVMNQVESNNSWAGASFPVEGFRSYLSLYGDTRVLDGAPEFNRGIDIAAANGSYVRNWLTGRVEQIASDNICGISVVIQSGPWRHTYCHLQGRIQVDSSGRRTLVDEAGKITLKEGQVVGTGNRIGRIGTTGRAKQAQLHWELQYGNRWIDPSIVLNVMYAQQRPQPQAPERTASGGTTLPAVVALRRAIIGQESAGNFQAVNPHSGALGYGQVMPFNVGPWSTEALGYALTAKQFLQSPKLQLQIIDHKLSQYWRSALRLSGGNESIAVRMVAAQWYSGDPMLYNQAKQEYYNGHAYPSIRDYTLSILQKYQNYRYQASN